VHIAAINGVRLYFEQTGRGRRPLVLVHGSWVSGAGWAPIVPRLAETHDVVTYDRRGHSRSPAVADLGSVHEDVADLAALIESLELGPACVVAQFASGPTPGTDSPLPASMRRNRKQSPFERTSESSSPA
jgi:pimeloyl-ACP methyl ester carboxylesterase